MLAFSKLAIHSPSAAVADQMAGGRSANRSNTKAIQAAELAVADIKTGPDVPVLNGAHAENGALPAAESLPAATNGINQPKARKSRASKAGKAAQSAVADIKPDPEAPVLNGAHAENGALPAAESLPTAMDDINQPKARKSRVSKAGKAAQSAVADIKPDPEAPVLNGAHPQNGALPAAESLLAAMNGINQPKARKSKASKAVKAAQSAVADIKPDPEAPVTASTHAENGALPEMESLPAAMDGTKPVKARKSRAKAKGSTQAPAEATVKLESGESVAAELAASIE